MATQSQKDQFIALTATGLNPASLDEDGFKLFLKDPEMWIRFGEFIADYSQRTYPPVSIVDLPESKFPDWSRGRILTGDIRESKSINFAAIMSNTLCHPCQLGGNGHEVLAVLVSSYKVGEDKAGQMYVVAPGDAIQGHFGLKELEYMVANWATLPPAFKDWAMDTDDDKRLYGYRDVVRNNLGILEVPFFCATRVPHISWFCLNNEHGVDDLCLQE